MQIIMKPIIGTKLTQKLVQLSMPKATLKEPTIMRKIVPGPRTVPTIRRICDTCEAQQAA